MRVIERSSTILVALIFMLSITSNASAYVDGGTGSFVLQALIAGVCGAAFVIKTSWSSFKHTIQEKLHRTDAPSVE